MPQVLKKIFILLILVFSLYSCSYDYYTMRGAINDKKLVVAVILPMTGQNANVSQSLLNAINLSYYETGNNNIVFKIYDLPTESKNTTSIVKKIISDGAQVILGPVFSESTKKVLAITDDYSIPVVSFSNDISLLQYSDNIFLASYPVINDMEMVVNYSSQRGDKSSKNYAILAPDNKYGDFIVSSATQAIQSRNLTLVKVVRYPDNKVNLSNYIVKLIPEDEQARIDEIKANLLEENKILSAKKQPLKKVPKPQLDFDTLIIGDYGSRLPVVVSHFSLLDIDYSKLTILGNSNWNIKDVEVEGTLNGAFYPSYKNIEETDFYKEYNNLYNKAPNIIDASAYDIVKVLASLASYDTEGDFVLNATSSALAAKMIFSGAYGGLTIRLDGIIVRPMLINKIIRGKSNIVESSSNLSYINYPNYRDIQKE